MFKKQLTFENYAGETVTKDFYFHLSKVDMMILAGDSMQERVEAAIAKKDVQTIVQEFRRIIKMSCGIRSEDGNTFDTSDSAQAHLLNSPAYDALIFDLMSDPNKSADFMKQLLPKDMLEKALKEIEASGQTSPFVNPPNPVPVEDKPTWESEGRAPTAEEVRKMDKPEMARAMAFISGLLK